MSQGPLCPNLTQKVQKEVSQICISTTHPMSKITRSAISRKLIDQNKQKKIVFWRIYFYTSMLVLGLKFKIQMAENHCLTFWTSVKSTLDGPANGSEVIYSKIQNRLRRAS